MTTNVQEKVLKEIKEVWDCDLYILTIQDTIKRTIKLQKEEFEKMIDKCHIQTAGVLILIEIKELKEKLHNL